VNPFLSVIVVCWNNERELPRTLYTLSPQFQKGITADQYEVIVVDNGSKNPPQYEDYKSLGLNLRIFNQANPTKSPVAALNFGLNMAFGGVLCAYIDGARMASPGLLAQALEAISFHPRAVVGSRGRYLGPLPQRASMKYGYNQQLEDHLLDSVDWKSNGYELFNISVFDESAGSVWTDNIAESNSLFMDRKLWIEHGGFDVAFSSPGGGFTNLDAWGRAGSLPDIRTIILNGEATFHQFHGGVATNVKASEVEPMRDEYIALKGEDYQSPTTPVYFWGSFTNPPPYIELRRIFGESYEDRIEYGPMKNLLKFPEPKKDQKGAGLKKSRTLKARVKRLGRRFISKPGIRKILNRIPPSTRSKLKRLLVR